MKYLTQFLEDDSSEVFKILELNKNEVEILRFMTRSYLDGTPSNSVYTVLTTIFNASGYEFLSHLEDIKNLLDYGYMTRNLSIFKADKIYTKLGLLYAEVELSEQFLGILEFGESGFKFPEISEYSDHLEYLKDQFLLIELIYKRSKISGKDSASRLDKKINSLKDIIKKRVEISKISLPLEQIFRSNALDEKEKTLFLAVLRQEYSDDDESLRDMGNLTLLVSSNEMERIKSRALLEDSSKLIGGGLMDYDELVTLDGVGKRFFIDEDVLQTIMHPQKNDKQSKKIIMENLVKESEIFELIEPKTDINDVVLNPKIKKVMDAILKQLDKNVIAKLSSWGIKSRKGIDAKILFYGPPGTGKTMSAISLAKSLKKQILSFDCSKILSKYVGESEQNVRKIFDEYKEICLESKTEPVLLLNEADQFLSSRLEVSSSSAEKMHNQMQNIFLEQIENFQGVIIATTNFVEGLDKAFSRRFDFKVEFKRPNYKERLRIWQKIIPETMSFEDSFSIEELAKSELSGAQIVLVLKNTALKVAIRDDEIFSMADFLEEIEREKNAAFEDDKKVGLL